MMNIFFFFFFQAEDGIRDPLVTGVQTCALPICRGQGGSATAGSGPARPSAGTAGRRAARQGRPDASRSSRPPRGRASGTRQDGSGLASSGGSWAVWSRVASLLRPAPEVAAGAWLRVVGMHRRRVDAHAVRLAARHGRVERSDAPMAFQVDEVTRGVTARDVGRRLAVALVLVDLGRRGGGPGALVQLGATCPAGQVPVEPREAVAAVGALAYGHAVHPPWGDNLSSSIMPLFSQVKGRFEVPDGNKDILSRRSRALIRVVGWLAR